MVTATEAKPKAKKPDHLTARGMVQTAILGLGEKKGSSTIAIKKYISKNYEVQLESKFQNTNINRFLRNAVERGELIQTKGHGANGRFKLPKTMKVLAEKNNNVEETKDKIAKKEKKTVKKTVSKGKKMEPKENQKSTKMSVKKNKPKPASKK